MMHSVLRKKAISSAAAGALLLGGLGLAVGGVIPTPLDFVMTSQSDDVPDDADVSGDDDDGGDADIKSDDDGPDENASQTAKDVHEAQRLAGELGDDAPDCAHGKYVSAAASGAWDPVNDPEGAPAFEDMPCFGHEGDDDDGGDVDGLEVDDEDEDDDDGDGPPAHAKAKGHEKHGSDDGGSDSEE